MTVSLANLLPCLVLEMILVSFLNRITPLVSPRQKMEVVYLAMEMVEVFSTVPMELTAPLISPSELLAKLIPSPKIRLRTLPWRCVT